MSKSPLPSSLKTFSTLGDNASPLERAIELAFAEQLYSIDEPFTHLHDANNVDARLLPILSVENQQINWSADDDEKTKRKLAGNAWEIIRHSGTPTGIKLVLDAFDYDAEFIPWHKQNPPGDPYTFEVIAWKRDSTVINDQAIGRLNEAIASAKSESHNFDLKLAVGFDFGVTVAGALHRSLTVVDLSFTCELTPSSDFEAGLSTNASVSGTTLTHLTFEIIR